MKTFTLAFSSASCTVTRGIVLKTCIDTKRKRVIGIPVRTSENIIAEFSPQANVKEGDRLFSIDFTPAILNIGTAKTDEYEDAALVYIPSSPHLIYDTERIFEYRGYGCFMGGVPINGRNSTCTDALLIIGSSECVYLDCLFKKEKIRTRQVVGFDGFELSAGIVSKMNMKPTFESKSPTAKTSTFGTSLADLLKNK